MENLIWQKEWYLGFLGFIGFYKWDEVMAFFQGEASWWGLANLLWFLWFLYFLPVEKS
ncbi:MAG: hypothetical protein KTR30_37460 [Saprospiraceae bacterium]|nr:hypothetical protein [Saprospiraceae bacterium]